MMILVEANSVEDFVNRYWRPDRLESGLVAAKQAAVDILGYCSASHHDNVTGQLIVWAPERNRDESAVVGANVAGYLGRLYSKARLDEIGDELQAEDQPDREFTLSCTVLCDDCVDAWRHLAPDKKWERVATTEDGMAIPCSDCGLPLGRHHWRTEDAPSQA